MPLIDLSHRVAFTFDNESEARDCCARLQDALPELVFEHRMGKNIPEVWVVRSEVLFNSTGAQVQSLADSAVLFGPVDEEARDASDAQSG